MALNAIAFAMMGLVYGMCHWILYCSGVRSCPGYWAGKNSSGQLVPEPAIGVMGQLAAAVGLLFMAFSLNFDVTLGAKWSPFLVVAGALYGFMFLATAICAVKQWDWRPVGDACLFGGMTQFLILPFAALAGLPWDAMLGLFVFGLLITNKGLLIHGRLNPRVMQANLVAAMFAAWWLMIFHGGLHAPLSEFSGIASDNNWAIGLAVAGLLAVVYMAYTYFWAPRAKKIRAV